MDTLRRGAGARDGHTTDVHAYLGYAGWSPGQLDAEISRGDWIVTPADAESVFDTPPGDVWRNLMRRNAGRLGAGRGRQPGMTPRERYRDELARGLLLPDPAQAALIEELDRVHRSLLARRDGGMLARLARRLGRGNGEPVRGLYVWGGVGRGKTHLVDLFHRASGVEPKLRIHFHRFMQLVHGELNALPDQDDPLGIVAARLAKRARVLCFDEFHVSDITDAMILGPAPRRTVRARHDPGGHVEHRAVEALRGRAPARAVPARDSAHRAAHEGGPSRKRDRLPVARAGADPYLVRAPPVPMPIGGLRSAFGRWAPEHVVDGGVLTILGRSVPSVPPRRRHRVVRLRDIVRGGPLGGRLHRDRPRLSLAGAERRPRARRRPPRIRFAASSTWWTSSTSAT